MVEEVEKEGRLMLEEREEIEEEEEQTEEQEVEINGFGLR